MLSRFSQSKFLIPAMVIIALLAAAAGFFVSVKQAQLQQERQATVNIPGLLWPNPKHIGKFETQAHDQSTFGLKDLQGKWSIIFFGFTNCPDVCPITLSMLANVYPELKQKVDNIQVLFVSVDPERDNSEKLEQYVHYYNEAFIGLGGDKNQVDSLTTQLGVPYYLNNENDTENYLVDHSASLYVIDPEGRLVGKLSPPHLPELIKQQFLQIQNFVDAQN